LLALYRATGNTRWLEGAVRGGESMLRHFCDGSGTMHPILRLPELTPLPRTPQWSRSPGCYQLKSAMAWADLARETGNPRWREAYEPALAEALASHRSFLPAESPEKTMDRLHAYCYFLEGILPEAERAEVRGALREGISTVSRYLGEIRHVFERSDVNAQLLRVRVLAEQKAGIVVDRVRADAEVRQIAMFQLSDPQPQLDGGYAFANRAGALVPHVNPVSAAFCSQALEMWSDYRNGVKQDLPALI
jgi:hypothetical protein